MPMSRILLGSGKAHDSLELRPHVSHFCQFLVGISNGLMERFFPFCKVRQPRHEALLAAAPSGVSDAVNSPLAATAAAPDAVNSPAAAAAATAAAGGAAELGAGELCQALQGASTWRG